jgi:hypothetical protein
MVVHDDGSGPALYVARGNGFSGDFIMRWDGSSWSFFAFASGSFTPFIRSLAVHDDGNGPALYIGGFFESVGGGLPMNSIAKWDGSTWSSLGSGMGDSVTALTSFDDGSGPALDAAGIFSTAGGIAANQIAQWDGSSWAPLASGLDGIQVYSLIGYGRGGLQALHAGGGLVAPDSGDQFLARWGCVPASIPRKVRPR